MSATTNTLFQTWYLDSRQGPFIRFDPSDNDGETTFVTRGLLGNTMNTQRGSCTISRGTIDTHGPIASTMMMDPPGFTTALASFPLQHKLTTFENGEALELIDPAGNIATLHTLPSIPAMAAVLGKTHVSTALEGSMSEWWMLRLPERTLYPCSLRPDEEDRDFGRGTKLQVRGRDAYDALTGAGASGGLDWPDAPAHERLAGTPWFDFVAGEDTVTAGGREYRAELETVEIPSGWGSTEISVPVLTHGDDKLVLIWRSFVSVVLPEFLKS